MAQLGIEQGGGSVGGSSSWKAAIRLCRASALAIQVYVLPFVAIPDRGLMTGYSSSIGIAEGLLTSARDAGRLRGRLRSLLDLLAFKCASEKGRGEYGEGARAWGQVRLHRRSPSMLHINGENRNFRYRNQGN